MSYILSHQDEFVKPTDIKIALTLLGEGMTCPIAFAGSDYVITRYQSPGAHWHFSLSGLVFAEGHTHKKQVRRVLRIQQQAFP